MGVGVRVKPAQKLMTFNELALYRSNRSLIKSTWIMGKKHFSFFTLITFTLMCKFIIKRCRWWLNTAYSSSANQPKHAASLVFQVDKSWPVNIKAIIMRLDKLVKTANARQKHPAQYIRLRWFCSIHSLPTSSFVVQPIQHVRRQVCRTSENYANAIYLRFGVT